MIEDLTLRQAVEMAVTTEQLGGKFYERMANRFSGNPSLVEIFNRLARDEKIHEAQFQALLKDLPDSEGITYAPEQMHFLKATAISKFFSRNALSDLEDTTSEVDALSAALEFEKSTLLYYQAIEEVLGVSPQLGEIIKAEKSHIAALMKVILTDAKFRGMSDNW